MQIQVTIPPGIAPSLWKSKATIVAKAEAARNDIEWNEVDLVVHTEQPGTYMTKGVGFSFLVTHTVS